MIRVRFHGRGGHGIKTASRILGTAAYLAGNQVQDSPVYGAERRGAAITAFTRISDEPILERGVISQPDLIVLADETLLDDAGAAVLGGSGSSTAIFLNAQSPDLLADRQDNSLRVTHFDVTSLTLEILGQAAALSSGLGAAAARLVGIVAEEHLLEAIIEELAHVGISSDLLEKNLAIAKRVYRELPMLEFAAIQAAAKCEVANVTHADPLFATPSILAAGNAEQRQTGAWRFERPEIDYDRCTRCGICFVRCPDGAILLDGEGYPVIDYDHCKGCMICWDQCPIAGAITKSKEVRAW